MFLTRTKQPTVELQQMHALHGEDSIHQVASGLNDVGSGVSRFVELVERLKP